MTILAESRKFLTVEVAQNEVIDREFYSDNSFQKLLNPVYFIGAGELEYSHDGENDWIAGTEVSTDFFSSDVCYPRFMRATGAGNTKVHFKTL